MRLAWLQPCRPGNRIPSVAASVASLAATHVPFLGGPAQLGSQLLDPAAIEGRDHVDGGAIDPIARQPAAEIVAQQSSLVGIQTVGLVEDEPHPLGVGRTRAEIRVEPLVVVLLRVDHPRHRVEARQEVIDRSPMLEADAVDVGKVEYGHARTGRPGREGGPLPHAEPRQQGAELVAAIVRDPWRGAAR